MQIKKIEVFKNLEEQQLMYGIVFIPDVIDAHGDTISPSQVQMSAHNYLINQRIIGIQHKDEAPANVVESYIAPVDFIYGEKIIKQGSWIVVLKVNDSLLWEKIKAGEYTGLSAGGYAKRVE